MSSTEGSPTCECTLCSLLRRHISLELRLASLGAIRGLYPQVGPIVANINLTLQPGAESVAMVILLQPLSLSRTIAHGSSISQEELNHGPSADGR